MSRDARISEDFADGTYDFRMGWGQWIEAEESLNAGAFVIGRQLVDGSWRVKHIETVIRLGLIGGGMKPADALRLVRTYVSDRPPLENIELAMKIAAAGLSGADDEKPRRTSTGDPVDVLENGKTRVADLYAAGVVMGFTPQQVNEMTIWQFAQSCDGFARANNPDGGSELSDAEADEIWSYLQEKDASDGNGS